MSAEKRLAIIGLDGATFKLLNPLMEQGKMPFLKRLIAGGCSGGLESVFPPITPVAWASFMTGCNPGKYGVFEFFERYHNPLSEKLVNSRSIRLPTLWEKLSQAGKRVNLFNLPLTYPIGKINGLVIGGFLAPENAPGFSQPPGLKKELEAELGKYPVMPKLAFSPGNEWEVMRELREMNRYHFQVVLKMVNRNDWDIMMYHFIAPDRAQHECWHLFDTGHPLAKVYPVSERAGREFVKFYRDLDNHLEKLAGTLDPGTNLMIISDHGFGPIHYFLDLNAWLMEKGYLVIKQKAASRIKKRLFELGATPSWLYKLTSGLGVSGVRLKRYRTDGGWWLLKFMKALFLSYGDIDWGKTRAYSQGNFGQIFINRKGRQPSGIVPPGKEAEKVIEEIARDLKEITPPQGNKPLIRKILYGEETYKGRYSHLAPDLSFLLHDMAYKPIGTLGFSSNRLFTPVFGNSGDHYLKGIFIAGGPLFRSGVTLERLSIMDLCPTIMKIMGVPVPTGLDGRVADEMF